VFFIQVCVHKPLPTSYDLLIVHAGELVVHEASFVDWEEDTHGPMDSASNRQDYPDNFRWTCCDKDGTREGCLHSAHRVAGARKRRRV
jgi:hypothetical protein